MKKLISPALAAACLLCLASCSRNRLFPLDEVSALISEKGYGHEQFAEVLCGLDRETVVGTWGEPNSVFSGLRGDIWMPDEELWVVLYYDEEWAVTDVIVGKPEL